jgi:hypothetical protein
MGDPRSWILDLAQVHHRACRRARTRAVPRPPRHHVPRHIRSILRRRRMGSCATMVLWQGWVAGDKLLCWESVAGGCSETKGVGMHCAMGGDERLLP